MCNNYARFQCEVIYGSTGPPELLTPSRPPLLCSCHATLQGRLSLIHPLPNLFAFIHTRKECACVCSRNVGAVLQGFDLSCIYPLYEFSPYVLSYDLLTFSLP